MILLTVSVSVSVALTTLGSGDTWQIRAAGIALSLGILSPVVADVLSNGLLAALRAPNIVTTGIFYWLLLDLVQNLYDIDSSRDTVGLALLAVGIFALGIRIATLLRPRQLKIARSLVKRQLTYISSITSGLSCFAVACTYYLFRSDWSVPTLVSGAFLGRGRTPWSRQSLGDTWAALEALTYFGYLVLPLVIISFRSLKNTISLPLLMNLVLGAIIAVPIISDGSRRSLGVILASSLVIYLLTSPSKVLTRKIKLRTIVLSMLLLSLALLSLNVLLATRGDWSTEGWTFEDTTIRVDDNFLRLCQTIYAVPQFAEYAGFKPILFAAVRPIPRAIWPGKPTDPGFTVHGFLGIGSQVSLSNSIVGELYSSWGFPAVLIGALFYGWLARKWDTLLLRRESLVVSMVYAVGSATLFVGLRSLNDLFLYCYPTLACVILTLTLPRHRNA